MTLTPVLGVVIAVGIIVDRATAGHAAVARMVLRRDIGHGAGDVGGPDYPRHAIGVDGVGVELKSPVRRVVSQEWSLDEYLYSLLPPERIVGVSRAAYEPDFSNIANIARRLRPSIAEDVEAVVRMDPDLVVVASTARADFTELLRAARVPVYRAHTMPSTLADIQEQIRILGYLTGSEARVIEAQTAFRSTLGAAALRRVPDSGRPLVLGLNGRYAYGSETLFDDVLRVLGAVNVAAVSGVRGYAPLSSEEILRSNPGWIVTGSAPARAADVLAQLKADPSIALTDAAQRGHIVVLDQRVFIAASPFVTQLIDTLGRALSEQASTVEWTRATP